MSVHERRVGERVNIGGRMTWDTQILGIVTTLTTRW